MFKQDDKDKTVNAVVIYEGSLGKELFFPLDVTCACDYEDMLKLHSSQIKTLTEHHDIISVTDDYNPLINPLSNEALLTVV